MPTEDAVPDPPPEPIFHLFPKLPAELRLKIWNFSLPGPRLVTIRCGPKSTALSGDSAATTEKSPATPKPVSTVASNASPEASQEADALEATSTTSTLSSSAVTGCTSPTPIPPTLHTCSESRAEALKSYRHTFGWARTPGKVLFSASNPKDILYFGPRDGYMVAEAQFHSCMSLCDPQDLALVRRVAVNDALFWIGDLYSPVTAASLTFAVVQQLVMRMPALEELIFVPHGSDRGSGSGSDGERKGEGGKPLARTESVQNTVVQPYMITPAHVDPAAAHERMSCQIQTALDLVRQQHRSWNLPRWRIAPLSVLTES